MKNYDLTCDENSKSRLCWRHVAPQRANAESLSKSIKGKSRDAQVRAPSPSLDSLILFLETWRTSFCHHKEEDQNNRNQLEMNDFTLYVFEKKLLSPIELGGLVNPVRLVWPWCVGFPLLPGVSCWPDARPPYTEDIRCKPSSFAMRGLQTWEGRQCNEEIGCVSHANANMYMQVCVIPAFGVDMELSACLWYMLDGTLKKN